MKRILVGLVLLAVIAGGAVAFGQSSDAPDPLAARITYLETEYAKTIGEIDRLTAYAFRIEGGLAELRRLQGLAENETVANVPEEHPSPSIIAPPSEESLERDATE